MGNTHTYTYQVEVGYRQIGNIDPTYKFGYVFHSKLDIRKETEKETKVSVFDTTNKEHVVQKLLRNAKDGGKIFTSMYKGNYFNKHQVTRVFLADVEKDSIKLLPQIKKPISPHPDEWYFYCTVKPIINTAIETTNTYQTNTYQVYSVQGNKPDDIIKHLKISLVKIPKHIHELTDKEIRSAYKNATATYQYVGQMLIAAKMTDIDMYLEKVRQVISNKTGRGLAERKIVIKEAKEMGPQDIQLFIGTESPWKA